ncbi:MAG: ABC transporter ATP-binding protein [Lachnospiraceae bacterium]|nr:ABC transporter ATP-binding protein [Lachnospiraceae bacterium]
MDTVLLKAENLRKTFRKDGRNIEAVKNVSFELHRGECLGLIGESGSGKSTVANLIAGLEKAEGGSLQMQAWDGSGYKDLLGKMTPAERRAYRSRLQMVFQNPRLSFNPAMTIGQGMEEAVRYYTKMPKAERQAQVLQRLEQVGLGPEYAKKYSSQMSGGECQRAAIARALMIQPELLICDEITSALDVSIQAQVMGILTRIQREMKMTCLFISHDLALVSTICDRVAVMYHGEIVEMGETEKIIHHSTNDYTRALLESVFLADEETMNRYEAEKRSGGNRGRL